MRPVDRPAASVAYAAVQAAAAKRCSEAQAALPLHAAYARKRAIPADVIKQYKWRQLTPGLGPPAPVSYAGVTEAQARAQLDAAFQALLSPLGTPAAWSNVSDAVLTTLGPAAVNTQQALEVYLSSAWAAITAGEKALAKAYPQARGGLVAGIGQYCSYCEIPMGANLAVEHMLPKADFPKFGATWTNFLLACPACNSRKNNAPGYAEFSNPPADVDGVGARALASMRFPSDDDYTTFDGAFRYVMRSTDIWGSPFGKPVDDNQLYGDQPFPVGLLGSSVHGVSAQFHRTAAEPSAAPFASASVALAAAVKAGTPLDASALPDDVRAPWGVMPASGQFQAFLEIDTPTFAQVKVVHITVYRFDTKTNAKLTVTPRDGAAQQINVKATNSKIWLLRASVPPDILVSGLGYRFPPAFVVEPLPREGVTIAMFDITLTSTYHYLFDKVAQTVKVIAAIETPMKLTLEPAVPGLPATVAQKAAFAKAAQTIKLLDLNDSKLEGQTLIVNRKRTAAERAETDENNLVNRRVSWRTRTWFVAKESLTRAQRAAALASATPAAITPAQFGTLMDLIVVTMKSTGCWSVWRYVAMKLPDLPNGATPAQAALHVKTQLAARMLNPANFPGTG